MNEEKEKLVKTLSEAHDFAMSVDAIQTAINNRKDEIYDLKSRKGNIVFTIIAIVVALVAFCPAVLIIAAILTPITGKWDAAVPYSLTITPILGVLMIIAAIIIDVTKNTKRKKYKAKRLVELDEGIETDTQKLKVVMSTRKEAYNVVPSGYMYPFAINYFIDVLKCGRADSMKEAMNLYEDQVHKWKIENLAESTLLAQQEANAIAAINATVNTVSAAANVATSIHTF